MRKRKPPVLLATLLVFMLVAVGIFFAPRGSGGEHDHGPQASNTPPPPAAETGPRPKMDASQVAGLAKGAMNRTATTDTAGPMGAAPGDSKPSIAVSQPPVYKPTPNESSTSTQWYTDQTKK